MCVTLTKLKTFKIYRLSKAREKTVTKLELDTLTKLELVILTKLETLTKLEKIY